MHHLFRYELHYAVRIWSLPTIFRSLLQGFVTAHYGANIFVPHVEGDALLYPIDDYPYLLHYDDLQSVSGMLGWVRDSFGAGEWRAAEDIMRSVATANSQRAVRKEFMRSSKPAGEARQVCDGCPDLSA